MSDQAKTSFWFGQRAELCDRPAIYRDDPRGCDPHIVVEVSRVYRPDDLAEMCGLANDALDLAKHLKAVTEWALNEIESQVGRELTEGDVPHVIRSARAALAKTNSGEARS